MLAELKTWLGARAASCVAAAAVLVAVGAMTAPAANARQSADPCRGNDRPHVSPSNRGTFHCGRVLWIPAHSTWQLPYEDQPPFCNAERQVITGMMNGTGLLWGFGGDWDYWTENGEWILWNGRLDAELGHVFHQPISVRPYFHNWGPHRWPVRVYFGCTTLLRGH